MEWTLKRGRAMPTGWRIAAMMLAAMMQFCATGKAAGQGAASSEYAVKAAFLFHFAQFVEWPTESFRDGNGSFVYCTMGVDPFKGALDAALSGKTVGGARV